MSRAGTTTRDRRTGPRRSAERKARGGVTPLPSRRRDSEARRRRRPFVRMAIAVVVGGVLAWVLWASPLLAVRTVQVDGASSLPADQVRQSAGIVTGTPLLRVDVAAARARVEGLPQIASAKVNLGWPDRVVITVKERVAVAVIAQGGQHVLVDASGVPFDTITGSPPAGVVPIVVDSPGPHDPATVAALQAVSALTHALREKVGHATATAAGEVTLTMTNGTTVVWGTGDKSPAKASALGGVLQQIGVGALGAAKMIDVSTPTAVVLR